MECSPVMLEQCPKVFLFLPLPGNLIARSPVGIPRYHDSVIPSRPHQLIATVLCPLAPNLIWVTSSIGLDVIQVFLLCMCLFLHSRLGMCLFFVQSPPIHFKKTQALQTFVPYPGFHPVFSFFYFTAIRLPVLSKNALRKVRFLKILTILMRIFALHYLHFLHFHPR